MSIARTVKFCLLFSLCLTNSLFAQEEDGPGNDFEDGGTVEDSSAPIDSSILWLVAAGIALAGYSVLRPVKK